MGPSSDQPTRFHIDSQNWLETPDGDPRGYIDPKQLKELWFHTGTICNLSCPFCLEGSKPGDDRLNKVTLDDVKPFVAEALELGVQQFSFTGGEPFVIKDMTAILDHCLQYKPCLVLTNGTKPLAARMDELRPLLTAPYRVGFRVSFDYPDAARHDQGRGEGNFDLSWKTAARLRDMGFVVSIARQREGGEDVEAVDQRYRALFETHGLPKDTRIVSFPDFLTPGSIKDVPHITEKCMTTYHDEKSRDTFMCNFSKMIVKIGGKMKVYACTLVDDDPDYDLGETLKDAMRARVMMKHHRCYSCFAQGASCSEI